MRRSTGRRDKHPFENTGVEERRSCLPNWSSHYGKAKEARQAMPSSPAMNGYNETKYRVIILSPNCILPTTATHRDGIHDRDCIQHRRKLNSTGAITIPQWKAITIHNKYVAIPPLRKTLPHATNSELRHRTWIAHRLFYRMKTTYCVSSIMAAAWLLRDGLRNFVVFHGPEVAKN